MGETMEDIRLLPEEEKFKIYETLEEKFHGKITCFEHNSGFPAIVVKISGRGKYITDCLSLEKWWRIRKGWTHFTIFPPQGSGFGISTKTKKEAIKKAATHFKVMESEIDGKRGWKITEEKD